MVVALPRTWRPECDVQGPWGGSSNLENGLKHPPFHVFSTLVLWCSGGACTFSPAKQNQETESFLSQSPQPIHGVAGPCTPLTGVRVPGVLGVSPWLVNALNYTPCWGVSIFRLLCLGVHCYTKPLEALPCLVLLFVFSICKMGKMLVPSCVSLFRLL